MENSQLHEYRVIGKDRRKVAGKIPYEPLNVGLGKQNNAEKIPNENAARVQLDRYGPQLRCCCFRRLSIESSTSIDPKKGFVCLGLWGFWAVTAQKPQSPKPHSLDINYNKQFLFKLQLYWNNRKDYSSMSKKQGQYKGQKIFFCHQLLEPTMHFQIFLSMKNKMPSKIDPSIHPRFLKIMQP